MIINSTIYKVFIILFLMAGNNSCKKDTKKEEATRIIGQWVGKEITFPSDVQSTYVFKGGGDTICPEPLTRYKILLYTDSTGCTDCKLKLYQWNTLIEEAETFMPGKIRFLFYFQPKEEKELHFILRRNNFQHAVYIDRQDKLNKTNKFPDNMSYQCFLLDEGNKVLLVGNPTLNPTIWELYKQTVLGSGNMEQKKIANTTVEIEQTEIELLNAKIHKSSTASFIIKNRGDVPLLIKDISASCGCTVPEWDKKPIKPGGKTEIKVKVTPDAAGYFRKTVTVFCNTEKGTIPLTVKGAVEG